MKNFIFKSDADFHKILFNKLHIISGNILYITHMQDKILKIVNQISVDSGVQKQVDDFYEESVDQQDDKESD